MSRTRIICPGCGFVQVYCQCTSSNEQSPMKLGTEETKECGLEDEKAGETLPGRPLVESRYIAAQYPVLIDFT